MKDLKLKTGLLPLPDDKRDFQLGAIIRWPKLAELGKEYFVEPLTIKDQIKDGNDDFCGACAGTGMIEPKEEVELFYPFLFAAAKRESGDKVESYGLSLRDVLKGLNKWGIPKTKDVPEDVKALTFEQRRDFDNYPLWLKEKAQEHRISSYFAIRGPYDHYDNARAAMWLFRDKKQCSLLGLDWGWPIEMFELTGTPEGFGHAVWHGGWYENGNCLINSAGKEAGREGKHSMNREAFNLFAKKYGLYMVVDLPAGHAEHMNEHGIKIGDPEWLWLVKAFISVWLPFLKRLWK